jgi:hypothetical protein
MMILLFIFHNTPTPFHLLIELALLKQPTNAICSLLIAPVVICQFAMEINSIAPMYV